MNDERTQQLTEISNAIRSCQLCSLGAFRTRAVPGEGPADAEIMLIGEGPGYHEDRQGRPFVGNSGKLLENLLASIKLTRDQVFITNVIKCRPPNNRDPLPKEISACTPYLQRQIEIIDPLLIVTLGRYSMGQFFPPTATITHVHGQPLALDKALVLPMFHPAAALRNPKWMAAMQADFLKIPDLLAKMRQKRQAQASSLPAPDDMEQLSLF